MSASLNVRATALADALLADAGAHGVAETRLANGVRLVDCGIDAPGGLEAGLRFAEITMGGLGRVSPAALILDGTWFPGVAVATDHPALACLAAQYAGRKVDDDAGYFAMASGPGRALIRGEPLFDDLDVDERADVAVLCLETRTPPPEPVAARLAERAGVAPEALTLLLAPTASVAGGVQVAARVVETALHKLHELGFDVGQVVGGFGTCPVPPLARKDTAAIGRTNDAVLYGGQVQLTVRAADDAALEALVPRLPSSASDAHGEPFGDVLERAGWDFYAIDPLLFSPAEVLVTNAVSGRSFRAGGIDLAVLERSFAG